MLCNEAGDRAGLQQALAGQAGVLNSLGYVDEALTMFARQAEICRELQSHHCLAQALANQALMLDALGRAAEALPLAIEAHDIAGRLVNQELAGQITATLQDIRARAVPRSM
jgi:hypothetical protein